MKKIALFLLLLSAIPALQAQGLKSLLAAVEQNNAQLKAAREANASILSLAKAENRPGETSVEYSPFYQSGVSGTSSSELIVSQEFDFPTLYAARNKANTLKGKELDLQYRILRRDILLEAKQTYYDLCRAKQMQSLLKLRLQTSDSLYSAFQKRLQQGDASLIDVNRIKMDRMSAQADYIKSQSDCQSLYFELYRLNSGEPVDAYLQACDTESLTSLEEYQESLNRPLEYSASESAVESSAQEVRIAQQGWAPKLTLGYRRNTELRETSNGFLVGVSFPLFSNSGKVKSARLQRSAAEYAMTDAKVAQDLRIDDLRNQCQQLQQLLQVYDEPLMRQQLSLLQKAVLAGELSVVDYYAEADRIYQLLDERLGYATEYAKSLAAINREDL